MNLKEIVSYFIPRISYEPVVHTLAIDADINGVSMVLRHEKSLGEDILYKSFDKKTNQFQGFVVKNIVHGYYGDVCNNAQDAIDSANKKWFVVMGFNQTQKQKKLKWGKQWQK